VKLLDVNILIHAHRTENPGHRFYHRWLVDMLEDDRVFLYCEWILAAFLRIVTRAGIYRDPTPLPTALEFVETIRSRPTGTAVMPGARHWSIFTDLCARPGVVGKLIPDAYLAALAIEANAEWVTSDSDFERFGSDLDLTLLRPPV